VDDSRQRFEDALRTGAYDNAWRYCCRLTASYEDAQDLLQDSLGHAVAQYARLRSRDSFRAWLLAIVRTRFVTGFTVRLETDDLPEFDSLEKELARVEGLPEVEERIVDYNNKGFKLHHGYGEIINRSPAPLK
jgi:DNA-directed RNA polymerase specialized sigma24 family protein